VVVNSEVVINSVVVLKTAVVVVAGIVVEEVTSSVLVVIAVVSSVVVVTTASVQFRPSQPSKQIQSPVPESVSLHVPFPQKGQGKQSGP
jgi:hypothetical protein